MLKSVQMRARSVATLGVMAALVVGGVAAAQDGSSSGSGSGEGQAGHPRGMPGGPPPMIGPDLKGLTYGEFHVQNEGQSEVIRLDQGKIAAVDDTSITLAENDGSEATVALDEDTQVMAGPGKDSTVDDLTVGERVLVSGTEGAAADSVIVAPKKGQLPKGGPGAGAPMPPPPLGS